MSHLLTQVSWLSRAFCTSGNEKVVYSCLQDLDLLFEWHKNFSPFFKRTTRKHTAFVQECVHAQMPLKNRVGMSSRTGDLGKTNKCSKIFMVITRNESVLGGANRHQNSIGNVSSLASCQVWEAGLL